MFEKDFSNLTLSGEEFHFPAFLPILDGFLFNTLLLTYDTQ